MSLCMKMKRVKKEKKKTPVLRKTSLQTAGCNTLRNKEQHLIELLEQRPMKSKYAEFPFHSASTIYDTIMTNLQQKHMMDIKRQTYTHGDKTYQLLSFLDAFDRKCSNSVTTRLTDINIGLKSLYFQQYCNVVEELKMQILYNHAIANMRSGLIFSKWP